MGKTGTTALQDFFFANREKLKEKGILYPEIGVQSGAHHLLSPHIPPFLKNTWRFLKTEEWAPQLSQIATKKILISSELIAWADGILVKKFCKELSRFFNLKIIIYLRRQDNLVMAGFNQQVKAGYQQKGLTEVLQERTARLDYESILAPWRDSVGDANMIVRPYERQQFYAGDIIKDFLFNCLEINDFNCFKYSTSAGNPRLSVEAVEYKRLINTVIPSVGERQRFLDPLMAYSTRHDASSSKAFSEHTLLSPEARTTILNRFEEGNARIAQDLMGIEDGRLFKDPVPKIESEWEPFVMTNDVVKTISDDLFSQDPLLEKLLCDGIEKGLSSDKYSEQIAAQTLCGGLEKYKEFKPDRPFLNDEHSFKKAKILYLHIGVHKTGTSALQEFFSLNESSLKNDRIYYPLFGRNAEGAHHNLLMPVNPNMKSKCDIFAFNLNMKFLKSECSGREKILLSSETLCKIKDIAVLNRLSELAETVKVIIYIRRTDDYLESAYSQVVKDEYTGTIKDFINDRTIDYKEICKRWASKFGAENIVVRVYEKGQFSGGSIFCDFMTRLGVQDTSTYTLPDSGTNPSLSFDAIQFKLLTNRLPLTPVKKRHLKNPLMDYSVSNGGGSKILLSEQDRKTILDKSCESDAFVAREFLKREDGILFSPPEKKSDSTDSSCPLSDKEIETIGRFIRDADANLFDALVSAIELGLDYGTDDERLAAEALKPVLRTVSKKKRYRTRFAHISRERLVNYGYKKWRCVTDLTKNLVCKKRDSINH
jgi:hypothetical protein